MIDVWTDPDKSARNMLLAIFFWFVGWTGIEALFTLYGVEVWGMTPDQAAFSLGFSRCHSLFLRSPPVDFSLPLSAGKRLFSQVSQASALLLLPFALLTQVLLSKRFFS